MASPGSVVPDGFEPEEDESAPAGFAPEDVDATTGAPALVRGVVGSSPQGDRLANLRKYFPDADPYGDDNFVFTDPKTNRQTLYNPPGFDAGDLASVGKEVTQMSAGALGGMAGAALSTPTGLTMAPIMVPAMSGLAMTGAGEAYDWAMRKFGGMRDTRSADEHALDDITDTAFNVLGDRVVPDVTHAVGRYASRQVRDRFTGSTSKEIYDWFKSIGAKPTAGMVGNEAIQRFENAAGAMPGGAGVIRHADEAVVDSLQAEAERLARQFGPPSTEQDTGYQIKQAAKRAITRFGDRSAQLYEDVAAKIPADVKAVPQSTLNLLAQRNQSELAQQLPNMAQQVHNPRVQKMLDTFAGDVANIPDGKVNYQALSYMRSRIGKMLGDPVAYSDFDRGELKQLYGSVTDDMNRIAKLAGPDAMKAHQLADRYYRFNMGKNIDFLADVVDKKWDKQAFDAAFSGSKDSGQKLAVLRRNMEPGEWDAVAGSTLRMMGMASPGIEGATGDVFNPAQFLTRMNALAPEAREALFGGTRYAQLQPEIERLTKLSAAFKELKGSRNFSNTGPFMVASHLITGGIGGGIGWLASGGEDENEGAKVGTGIMGGLVSPYVAAKLLTNPKFVHWLADSTRDATQYNKWAGNLGRLVALAKAEPDIRDEIHDLLKSVK